MFQHNDYISGKMCPSLPFIASADSVAIPPVKNRVLMETSKKCERN